MRRERSAFARLARGGAGCLVLAACLLAPVTSPAVTDEVRGLLREIGLQVPSREVAAPAFSLPDADGKPVELARYKGRAVMIYFWTTY